MSEPLAVFAQAYEYGRERADVLSAQMKAMLGDWPRIIASLTWYNLRKDDLFLSPLFATELLPLLVRHDQLAHPHDLRPLPRLKEYAPEPVRALIADYEARADEPGFRLTFGGGPEFNAAVHAVADPLASHPAFQVPDHPTARSGPLVTTLYASGGPVPVTDPLSDPAKVRTARAALCDEAWPELRAALRLWRPVCEDHIAPISLLADPVLAQLITQARGHEILATPRGTGPGIR